MSLHVFGPSRRIRFRSLGGTQSQVHHLNHDIISFLHHHSTVLLDEPSSSAPSSWEPSPLLSFPESQTKVYTNRSSEE